MFGETCRIKLYDPVQECVGFLVLSSEHIKYSKDTSSAKEYKTFLANTCSTR